MIYVCLFLCIFTKASVHADIEYNTINEDGSFRFRHKNDDIGGYYHNVDGTPDNNVRGRYGSRNPVNGRIEETIYTAGPRGFRVNGPGIHRKMDTAQFPVLPRLGLNDPLSDPYDVPTYSFSYRAADHSRSEENDAAGRLKGLYSYIDDVGERHTVRYAASASTGYEVTNAIPDNPVNVAYTGLLYKAHPTTRGKMAVQRGPGGTYKLIATGPDHRRAESRDIDGLVRGTYSFLDDKGTQRTVEYIAGAGIGYRVIQNSIGPGTHINPSTTNFRLTDSNFRLANNFANDGYGNDGVSKGASTFLQSDSTDTGGSVGSTNSGKKPNRNPITNNSQSSGDNNWKRIFSSDRKRPQSTRTGDANMAQDKVGVGIGGGNQSHGYLYDPPSVSANNYELNDDDVVGSLSPLVTANTRMLKANRDWRDSTIIKNVGKWYVGLSPGQSIRAHVQNIDIVPLNVRNLSPSEALRQDEVADLIDSKET